MLKLAEGWMLNPPKRKPDATSGSISEPISGAALPGVDPEAHGMRVRLEVRTMALTLTLTPSPNPHLDESDALRAHCLGESGASRLTLELNLVRVRVRVSVRARVRVRVR